MMKTWILLQMTALVAVSLGQDDCSRGACYPRMGDLLIGREQRLNASSTCGLTGTEVFCSPYREGRMKCCPCDSRNSAGRHAHTIQDVLSSAGTGRWWMSKKDANPVSIQLGLEGMFQLDNLVMTFKGPRPDALVIERTEDGGKTWKPARYMATNCPSAFPQASTRSPHSLHEASCYTLSPPPANPYLDQTIQFSPTRQYTQLHVPESRKIEAVAGFNGLRINLTELGPVPGPGSFSRYFALREVRVIGTCFCHGHANRCLPLTYTNQLPDTQVNARCECQHHTTGMNCERCEDLYNDQPWRHAEENNPHTCQRCNCNNHAQLCRFDPARYEATGRRSGGVCENCLHHTTGPNCERCAPNYYPNPSSSMDRPDACLRCSCNAAGSEDGGQCDPNSGRCRCKANVEGANCDRCKAGYYGLSASNPLGCSNCDCSSAGSLHGSCDPVTGQCPCRPNVHGLNCDRCAAGFWNPSSPTGCQPCGCHPSNAIGATCDQTTGECICRSGFAGRTCSGCPDFTYGDPRTGCRACQCDRQGTASCDQSTGACLCHPGVTGARCDSCARGRCGTFPECPTCPSCFTTLDAQLGSLIQTVQRLSSSLSQLLPGGGGSGGGQIPGNLGLRISALEDALADIGDQLTLPPPSQAKLDRTLGELTRLRELAERLGRDASVPLTTTDLQPALDQLQALLDALKLNYDAKKNALITSVTDNSKGALDAIKKAFEDSNDAVKQADATAKKVDESAGVRQDALDMQDEIQAPNTKDLDNLNKQLATRPNLTPTAVQVCGSKRTEPCTPERCDGELCSPDAAQSCLQGERCVGALPTAGKAQRDTEEVKAKLKELGQNVTEANSQMLEMQDSANQIRKATDEQANQIKKARDELEADLQDTRDFVRQIKQFLSDPSADPEQIERVSEEILNAKLPLSLEALKRKLDELEGLAAELPDSSRILEESQPQLEQARRLLEEAQRARDAAVGVKEDVGELLDGLAEVDKSLGEMADKVKGATDILERINPDKIKSDLDASEQPLSDLTSTLGDDIPTQLDDLKNMVTDNEDQAQTGLDNALNAKDAADGITTDMGVLEDKLNELRDKAADAGDATEAGDTLRKLQDDVGKLMNYTSGIMGTLEDKEASLRQAMDEISAKSLLLEGLDTKLEKLLGDIKLKAEKHSTCIA